MRYNLLHCIFKPHKINANCLDNNDSSNGIMTQLTVNDLIFSNICLNFATKI